MGAVDLAGAGDGGTSTFTPSVVKFARGFDGLAKAERYLCDSETLELLVNIASSAFSPRAVLCACWVVAE